MQGKVGQQQGWVLCVELGQQGPLKGFKKGALLQSSLQLGRSNYTGRKGSREASEAATVWFKR